MLRARKTLITAVVLLGALMFAASPAALAEDPAPLGSGHVTDHSGVLTDAEQAELETQLSELAAADNRPELFVILVDDFEGPSNALSWADQTAMLSNLAPDQYLLAIATEGRSLAISAEYGAGDVKSGPLSESRVIDIENELGSKYLADDDWAGGISFVAHEFDKVPWPAWAWVLIAAGCILVMWLFIRLVGFIQDRMRIAAEMRTLEGQKKRAARQLVRSDEAVRTSEQELGFVTAEFGDETTAEFRTALEECRVRLQSGFDLLQKLEDSVKDTAAETRTWTNEIIRLCNENEKVLEERKRALASLRALAEDSEKTLARLQAARADASTLEQDARDHLASLATAVPSADLVGVISNPDEIAQRLRDADAELAELAAAVTARKPRAISRAVHEVERLLAEASELRIAIGAQAQALAGKDADSSASGASTLERAEAAVRAAEASVQARPGQVGALALSRLNLARRQITAAATASANPAKMELLTESALGLAQQVQSLINAPAASGPSRSTAPLSQQKSAPLMHDTVSSTSSTSSSTSSRRSWSTTTSASERSDRTGPTVVGALSGGVGGFILGLSLGNGAGLALLFGIFGVVFGALSGAFGKDEGGGSSGWGGSSSSRRSSWSSSSSRSRSSSRSSSSRSRSSGGSRSSGRSGGRRF